MFDESGIDVTPLPLLHLDPNVLKKNQGNILGDSSGGTVSQFDILNTGFETPLKVYIINKQYLHGLFPDEVGRGEEYLHDKESYISKDIYFC